jgi:hypothetical protein
VTAGVEFPDPQPNGLATMLGVIIGGNLAAHPERETLLSKRATFAIRASDVGVAASVRLLPVAVTVRNGLVGTPNIVIETDSETLVGLANVPLRFGLPDITRKEGRDLIRKLLGRQLKVKGMFAHPARLARLNKLLASNEGGS